MSSWNELPSACFISFRMDQKSGSRPDLQTGVGWVISYPVALFMGGSRSQEERKAAANAVKTAYADFFESPRLGK